MQKTVSGEFVAVLVIIGLGVFAMDILQPVLPLYLTSIGVTPEILGLMLSVAMVGMVIGESSWGWVADKVGLKIPLSMATFASAIVVLCFVLTQNVPVIFLIFFFWGLLRSALFGPGRGYIAAAAPPLKKATFLAIAGVTLSTSRSLAALPSGFIVDNWGYHWVFFVSCGVGIIGGLVVLTGLGKIRLVRPKSQAEPSLSTTDKFMSTDQRFSYRFLAFQCVVAALYLLGVGVLLTFLPLLATQVVGVGATEIGLLFAIFGLSATVTFIPMGILADRKGKRAFMILSLLVSGAAMAGMAFAVSFLWLIVFVIISGLAFAMFSPAAQGILSESVSPQRQSTAMGIYGGLGENMGIIAGSALGGFVWISLGPQATFLMGTVAAGLGAALCFFGLSRDKVSTNL